MRIVFLTLTLVTLVGCNSEEVASEDAISGIKIPANISGVPSVN